MVYQYVNKLCFRKVLGFSSPYFFSFLKQFRFSFSYFARSQLFRIYVFLYNFAPEIGARAPAKMIPSCIPVVWPVRSRNLKLVLIHVTSRSSLKLQTYVYFTKWRLLYCSGISYRDTPIIRQSRVIGDQIEMIWPIINCQTTNIQLSMILSPCLHRIAIC